MKLIAVEGNIGAGKSTLLPELAEALGYTPILEPVDTDEEFRRLLDNFSKNSGCVVARNEFQMYMTNQRSNLLIGLDPEGSYIIERSLLSDLVFTHACMANYEVSAEDAAKHMDCYKHLISRLHDYPHIDLCLYLKTEPQVAYNRMRQRGRKEEMGTPYDYIEDLDAFHDAVLPQACRKAGTPLVEMNWNTPLTGKQVATELWVRGFKG